MQKADVPIMAFTKLFTPQAIPTAIEAKMKATFLGLVMLILKRKMASAPKIPKPRAILSPIDSMIVAVTIAMRISD